MRSERGLQSCLTQDVTATRHRASETMHLYLNIGILGNGSPRDFDSRRPGSNPGIPGLTTQSDLHVVWDVVGRNSD